MGRARVGDRGGVDKIPDRFGGACDGIVEHALVEQALHTHPGEVVRAGQVLLNRIDRDGEQPRDDERQRRRAFGTRKDSDGMAVPGGRLTPMWSAVWDPILDALSAPIPADENGERDDRTATQRRHDALIEAGLRLLRSGTLPDCGGMPVTIGPASGAVSRSPTTASCCRSTNSFVSPPKRN